MCLCWNRWKLLFTRVLRTLCLGERERGSVLVLRCLKVSLFQFHVVLETPTTTTTCMRHVRWSCFFFFFPFFWKNGPKKENERLWKNYKNGRVGTYFQLLLQGETFDQCWSDQQQIAPKRWGIPLWCLFNQQPYLLFWLYWKFAVLFLTVLLVRFLLGAAT